MPQEASDNGNGLAVIIEQFKGFVMVIVPTDMVDSHGSLTPSLASKHPFLSRTHALQGFKCPHNLETAFEKRFQAMLHSAWHKRNWHVIVADPGSGKTMDIRDMVKTAGSAAILAVTSPKNNDDEQALGDQLFGALGVPSRGHWSTRKPKLMGHLHHYGTQCLIVDDAQDLSLQHLMFIKELTDQGRLQYDHTLGLCLVAAGRGDTIPLKETLDFPDIMWLQFRRRMDKLEPFCRIAGHTSEEVRDILAALEWSYEAGDTSVRAETLEKAAELLVLRRNTLRLIDGAGPDGAEEARANGTEPQRETVQGSEQQNTTETVGTVGEQV
ncbi:hypothetical protein ccbrp13_16170 [Ktedonobacteria bacterium brp13]|nr:hypothetical protein ccbrp13_16170 [Ktedonobacteria bacterium brp13]